MKLDHFHTPYTKMNSKWMKDLNMRQEAIKILEEKRAATTLPSATATSYSTSLEAREIQTKMNYWDLRKIKSVCTAKETINKTKGQLMEWEKIFANDILDKGLTDYKELIKTQHPQKIIIQLRNGQKT